MSYLRYCRNRENGDWKFNNVAWITDSLMYRSCMCTFQINNGITVVYQSFFWAQLCYIYKNFCQHTTLLHQVVICYNSYITINNIICILLMQNAMPSFPLPGLPLPILPLPTLPTPPKMVAEFTVAEFSGCPVFRCPVYCCPVFHCPLYRCPVYRLPSRYLGDGDCVRRMYFLLGDRFSLWLAWKFAWW